MLKSPARRYRKQERKRWYTRIREVLGAIVLLQSPLSASSLARLLCVPAEDVHRTLYELHSILDVPQNPNQPVRLHHPSFRDFLLDRDRCGDNFWVDEKLAHQHLADKCIQFMSNSLREDICGVGDPSARASDIEREVIEQYIPLELQYACLYGLIHLVKGGIQLCDDDKVHNFLKKHCFHWLEALSWLGKISQGIHTISSLQSMALVSRCGSIFN